MRFTALWVAAVNLLRKLSRALNPAHSISCPVCVSLHHAKHWGIFMADILTCQSRKSTGGISYINDISIPLSQASLRSRVLCLLTDMVQASFRPDQALQRYAFPFPFTLLWVVCLGCIVSTTGEV